MMDRAAEEFEMTSDNQIYRALIDSSAPPSIPAEDRHLFACLLAIATQESVPLHQALNLSEAMLNRLLHMVFPAFKCRELFSSSVHKTAQPHEVNPDIEQLLLNFTRKETCGWAQFASLALARIIAARVSQPGHLWIAMGLSERPQLSAAIGRHLPDLLAANDKGMRWKIFLFKQVCELNGGTMCKSPVCGDCSDYSFCFAE